MSEAKVNNGRIAKNTMWLYVRQIVMMLIGLYTSRIELEALGVTDYGVYTVVGGVVLLFSFLYNAMTTAIQRALNYDLGRDKGLSVTFNVSMRAQLMICGVLVLVAETVGLWYLTSGNVKIPAGRETAAMWVYQLTVLTCVIQVLRVPYNAMVVAYERMNFFAYLSIVEATLKLALVAILLVAKGDTLILYAALIVVLNVVVTLINKWYCNRRWTASRIKSGCTDKEKFRQIMGFSGWTLLGSAADVGVVQGLNLVINAACAPGVGIIANAAAGIATKVSGMVNQFVSNFQTAFRPQIVKSYAAHQLDDFFALINRAAKFSYFLLWIAALPLIINMQFALNIWLKDVPNYAVEFCQWTMLYLLVDAISAPLWMASQAQGKIRNYQIMVAVLLLSNLPLAYFMLRGGLPVWSVIASKFGINLVTHFARMIYLKRVINLPVWRFMKEVMWPVAIVTALSLPLPLLLMAHTSQGWGQFIGTSALSIACVAVTVTLFGLTVKERTSIKAAIKAKMQK